MPDAPRAIGELPYDFSRRMLSVLLDVPDGPLLVTKGAFAEVLARCALDEPARQLAQRRFEERSADGARVLAVAVRRLPGARRVVAADESEMQLAGLLCLEDPPKPGAASAIDDLRALGVRTIMVTGDNRHAATRVAALVGLAADRVMTGAEVTACSDDALREAARSVGVFAEIDPLQKERIVAALRQGGSTVGYLGDGINDAPSLRSADVGLSVDDAVDIAKHAASVVLLRKDLSVIAEGIRQGRRVFANTVTYVRVTISANFGNICSMAVAALLLPFLPLLPRQILLLNVLSDLPAVMIAGDRVDPERTTDPHGWDLRDLRRFMVVFGALSSVADLTCFAVLRFVLDAEPARFRTTWFVTSVLTELTAMLVLRTQRRCWRSRPGTGLLAVSAAVAVVTLAVPWTPLSEPLGLAGPDAAMLILVAGLAVAYLVVNEAVKRRVWHPSPPGAHAT